MTDINMPPTGGDGNGLLTPSVVQGELRILDVSLASRLGFAEPRMIRKLIKRHIDALLALGRCDMVEHRPERGGKLEQRYYLNRKQAIFITAKSDTPAATDITIEIIERFDAYERGLAQPVAPAPVPPTLTPQEAWAYTRVVNSAARIFPDPRAAMAVWSQTPLPQVPIENMTVAQFRAFTNYGGITEQEVAETCYGCQTRNEASFKLVFDAGLKGKDADWWSMWWLRNRDKAAAMVRQTKAAALPAPDDEDLF